MDADIFFKKINSYVNLTKEAELAWAAILKEKVYARDEHFIAVGQVPRNVAFVVKGLFSQYYIADNGATVIKYFFPEGRIAGSVPATLTKTPSLFAVQALEDTTVIEYDYNEFKKLATTFSDIAAFYIRYMEQHWVIEKEPLEIMMKNDTAAQQYSNFLKKYPDLVKRLKKHHIASYLGITPTQLSRIFGYNK